ncbi:MAG: hypothetical protein KDI30_10625 [Pseudomonadales bacterium]|nr:hypothetical protein [Pseudomonadales bacterium]
MSPFWVIGLIILVALSSLYQVMPNKRQRMQARLRQYAAEQGLRTRLILKSYIDDKRYHWHPGLVSYALPWQDKALMEKACSSGKQAILLARPANDSFESSPCNLIVMGAKARYSAQELDIIAKQGNATLSVPIIAVEINAEGVAIHWLEQGSVETIKKIEAFLRWLQTYLSTQL